MKEASFVTVEHDKEMKKKLINTSDVDEDNNRMSNSLFAQSKDRLTSILDTNKTVGLDELMNLLKN